MNEKELRRIAEKLLGKGWLLSEIQELLHTNKIERAKNYLLDDIEFRFQNGQLSLEQASEYYAQLDAPRERVLAFPQRSAVRS